MYDVVREWFFFTTIESFVNEISNEILILDSSSTTATVLTTWEHPDNFQGRGWTGDFEKIVFQALKNSFLGGWAANFED